MLQLIRLATLGCAASALAGPLSPPAGPVAPTSKSLAHVEPGTAITAENTPGDADSTYKITEPGHYYLIENLTGEPGKHGIEIFSANVSIDLRGFALLGNDVGLDAINSQASEVSIRNGFIFQWTGDGIDANNRARISFEDLTIRNCGGDGIDSGASCSFRNIKIIFCDGDGIEVSTSSYFQDCNIWNCGQNGILAGRNAIIDRCYIAVCDFNGMDLDLASVVTNSIAESCGGSGIDLGAFGRAEGNTVRANAGNGILTLGNSVVVGNIATQNGVGSGGRGIYVSSGGSLVDSNYCRNNDVGIQADASNDTVIRNVCSANNVNEFVLGGSQQGPIVSGGGVIVSTSPWANFDN